MGLDAFQPLDDSSLRGNPRGVPGSLRIIGVEDRFIAKGLVIGGEEGGFMTMKNCLISKVRNARQRDYMGDEKLTDRQRPPRFVLDSLPPGKRLRLREDTLSQIKEREWFFHRIVGNMVFLNHEDEPYGMVVGIEDIDWTSSRAIERK